MTVRFLALYQTPTDPEALDRHYREVHIPLGRRLPGQGILHLWLLPGSYLVVCMTNGTQPGGQWSSVKWSSVKSREMSRRAYTCGLAGFGLI